MQNVDHHLLQASLRIPDDHLFLHRASREFGTWFSGKGIGVDLSHNLGGQRRHSVSRIAVGGR